MKKFLFILIFLELCQIGHCANYTQDANAVMCLTMEEGTGTSTDDVSANSNVGNFYGTTNPVWYNTNTPAAYSSWALDFDGATSMLDCGNSATFDNLGPISGVVWINADSNGESNVGRIFDHTTSSSSTPKMTLRFYFDRALQFMVDGTTDLSVITSQTVVSFSTWTHVALVWDGTFNDATTVHIYLGGVETTYATQTNGDTRASDSGNSFWMGGVTSLFTHCFNGRMDEMEIFSRTISSTEINDIKDNGLVGTAAGGTTQFPIELIGAYIGVKIGR